MPTSPASAKAIADDLLQRTGRAMQAGELAAFAACFHFPTVVVTEFGENSLNTRAELELVFNKVRESHRRMNVTEVVRHTLAAVFNGPDIIKTSHETRLLSGSRLVEEPFPAISTLQRTDGKWGITRSEYAVPSGSHRLFTALAGKDVRPEEET